MGAEAQRRIKGIMNPTLTATATAVVKHEHDSAEAVVQTLLAIAGNLDEERRIDISLLKEVVFFLRVFADQCQTGQEDALLFSALEAKCMPAEAGLLANLKNDHQDLVALTRELSEATGEYALGKDSANEHLGSTLRRLAALYRAHISTEDHIVLPLAEKLLSPEELNTLNRDFQRVESQISLDEIAERISAHKRRCSCYLGEVFN